MSSSSSYSRLLGSKEWLRMRKHATYISIFYGFLIGMEYSAIVISLPFYLEQDIKTDQSRFFYGLITATMAFSAALSGVVFGRLFDKTRNLRAILVFFPLIGFLGNFLYTINYSPWFLVAGRFLCGMTDSAQSAITGEYSRLYTESELVDVLTKYQSFYSVGFVIGPATAVLFQPINFQLSFWHINANNFIGVFYMIALVTFSVIAFIFAPSMNHKTIFEFSKTVYSESNNCGKIYGNNENIKTIYNKDVTNNTRSQTNKSNSLDNNKNNTKTEEDIEMSHVNKSQDTKLQYVSESGEKRLPEQNSEIELFTPTENNELLSFKDLFLNFDVMLIILSSALAGAIDAVSVLNINIIALLYFKWPMLLLAIVTTVCTLIYILVIIPFGTQIIGGTKRIFILYCLSMVLCCVPFVMIIISKNMENPNMVDEGILVSSSLLFLTFFGMSIVILARKLLLRMVPFHSASFAEGVRNMFVRLFGITGFFTASFILPEAEIILPIIICVAVSLTLMFYLRRKFFS